MAGKVYRKTAAGQAEVRERGLPLTRADRSLLILCNGRLDTDALKSQFDMPVEERLASLCQQGLLEEVAPEVPKAQRPAAVPPAPSGPTAAAAAVAEVSALASRLSSFFGPRSGQPASALSELPDHLGDASGARGSAVSPTLESDTLKAIVRRGWLELGPLFGPGVEERMEPLLRARDLAQMRRALNDLRDTLSIYRGRKEAAEVLRRIERG